MGDYHILMQFDIDAGLDTIRRALTTQDGIRSWWSTRTDGPDQGMDGQLRVSFPDVPQPFELEVTRDDTERVEWAVGAISALVGWHDGSLGAVCEPGWSRHAPPVQPSGL